MIDQASEVNNDVANKRYDDAKGSTRKVAQSKKIDLRNGELEQNRVGEKGKSGKEKSKDFRNQYAKKYADSKSNTKQNESNIGEPEIGTYSSNQLSQGIQGLNLEAKKRQLFKNSKDKELGE